MIEHIFIKNYKAFERENIPLDKHTLLMGTNHSGKTTVLEALDLFFNDVLVMDYIRDQQQDVVVEIHMNDERYRKVYAPPQYSLDFTKCIGTMFDIHHIKYLYVPTIISNPKLLNDILSINLTKPIKHEDQATIYQVSDYIDGILGNSNYQLFDYRTIVKMNINQNLSFTNADYGRILTNVTYPNVIIGIDNVEHNFDIASLDSITTFTYQTIFSTNDNKIVNHRQYYVSTLYKGNKIDDFDTIKKRLRTNRNTVYVLVEGKYDVNWFETAIHLLGGDERYTVIPCGGAGNITFVKHQLEKEGYRTVVITDGDTGGQDALSKDVIELYADVDYINQKFHTNFTQLPVKKKSLFRAITVKDDVVKNVLSRWAKNNLTLDHPFVQEVAARLENIQ